MKDKLTSCAGLSPSCVLEIHHSNNFLRKPEYNPPPPQRVVMEVWDTLQRHGLGELFTAIFPRPPGFRRACELPRGECRRQRFPSGHDP